MIQTPYSGRRQSLWRAYLDFGSPGFVPALISSMFLTPSPSLSSASIFSNLNVFFSAFGSTAAFARTSFPYGFSSWSSFFGRDFMWHVEHLPREALASGYFATNAFWLSRFASSVVPTQNARRTETAIVVFFIPHLQVRQAELERPRKDIPNLNHCAGNRWAATRNSLNSPRSRSSSPSAAARPPKDSRT